MNPEERITLETLDRIVRLPQTRALLDPTASRVREHLRNQPKSVMAWEPLPLLQFANVPSPIRSAWIFVLRAGANTGPERHPNSHQRMMSYAGTGDLQTRASIHAPWQSNLLVSDADAPLQHRWISIPQNMWHQPVIPANDDWTVVSFHTVTAEELIEERPDPSAASATKQMHYVG